MSLEAYDYFLPEELIAQEGVEPRDRARMLVVHREGPFRAEHRQVRDLPEYLRPGDVLVFNESKVIPARLLAQRPTGGRVEVLLVRERAPGLWEALVGPGRKAKLGTRLRFLSPRDLRVVPDLEAEVVGVEEDGVRLLRFQGDLMAHLEEVGEVPLPPLHQGQNPSGTLPDRVRQAPGLRGRPHCWAPLHPGASGPPEGHGGGAPLPDPARGPRHLPPGEGGSREARDAP